MNKKVITVAVGTAMGMTLSAGVANADVNPFTMNKLASGYTIAMSDTPDEGKCGGEKSGNEAKCGAEKAKAEAKCGGERPQLKQNAVLSKICLLQMEEKGLV